MCFQESMPLLAQRTLLLVVSQLRMIFDQIQWRRAPIISESSVYWGSLLLGDDELRLQPLVHFLSPAHGFLHVVANVFFSDYLGELGLVDQLRGLFARTAENQRPFAGVQLLATSSSCLLYTSPSPRDLSTSRMPASA